MISVINEDELLFTTDFPGSNLQQLGLICGEKMETKAGT